MKANLRKYFLFHLAIVIAICVVLYTLFFITLKRITAHGIEVKMPDVTGKDLATARKQLEAMHFNIEVDSLYDPALKPLTIIRQMPDTGSMVKNGRIVMLTVNMVTPPQIPMPNLTGLYYTSAEMMLRNNKLLLADTFHRPDINPDMVLKQVYNGDTIQPGDMIPQGSKISLIIGDGIGNTLHDMPNVTALSVDAALTILSQYHVKVVYTLQDSTKHITDTADANVVDQYPHEKNDAGIPNHIKDSDFVRLTID